MALTTFFAYIATKSTADPYLPPMATSLAHLARDTADGFLALSGGRVEVGRLEFYPTQRSVANHLLCDGREVPQASYPELYAYLGNAAGTPVDPLNFILPNYLTALTPATTAATETTNASTTSTPVPASPPPAYNPVAEDPTYGPVESGGRYRDGAHV